MARVEAHGSATPEFLSGHLAQVVAEREGVLAGGDPTSVHRMRVASRRLRAALSVAASGLGKKQAKHLRREARRVTRALGPWREAAVSQALLDELAETAAGPASLGMAYLRATHAGVVDKRRRKAVARLHRVDLELLAHRLAAGAEPGPESGTAAVDAPSLLEPLAARAEAAAVAARRGWGDTEVHGLRIAVKRLRYAVELVGQRVAGKRLASRLKKLQDALGRCHDVAVAVVYVSGEEARLRRARIASLAVPVAAARERLLAVKAEALAEVVAVLKLWPRGSFRRLALGAARRRAPRASDRATTAPSRTARA